jgi:hypothetical protein
MVLEFEVWIKIRNGLFNGTKSFFRDFFVVFGLDINFKDPLISKKVNLTIMIVLNKKFFYIGNEGTSPRLSRVFARIDKVNPVLLYENWLGMDVDELKSLIVDWGQRVDLRVGFHIQVIDDWRLFHGYFEGADLVVNSK